MKNKVIKVKRFNKSDYYYERDLDKFLTSLNRSDFIDLKHESDIITTTHEYTTVIYLDKYEKSKMAM